MSGPFFFCHVDSQEFGVVDTLHLLTIYVERGVCGLHGSPKVHNFLLRFCGFQDQNIAQTSCDQMLDPSLQCVCSLCDISPTTVVSSANLVFEKWMGVQS